MAWLITLLILILLLSFSIVVKVEKKNGVLSLWAGYGPFCKKILPSEPKPELTPEEQAEADRKAAEAKAKKEKKRFRAWEIVLLILGSPLWIALIAAAFAIIIALLCALWSVVVSLWSVFASFAACSLGGLLSGVSFFFEGHGFSGASMIACSLFFAGLSIFAFFGCRALTKGSAWLTANTFIGIKNLFTKKEEV